MTSWNGLWRYYDTWIESHDDLHPECTDIVYLIVFTNGQKYVGKKAVRAKRKYPPLKGKKRVRRKWKNLPFKNYQGSAEEAKALEPQHKIILNQCSSLKTATYLEAEYMFNNRVLFDPNFINANISGVYFSNSLEGVLDPEWVPLRTLY